MFNIGARLPVKSGKVGEFEEGQGNVKEFS